MNRLARLTVRLASALALLALVGGLPAALARFIGSPLPHSIPTTWAGWSHVLTGGFPDTAVVNLLAIALWLVWAAFVYSLIGELAAARRGRPARTLRVISPVQALAALLVAGLSAPAAASVAMPAPMVPVISQANPAAAPPPVVRAVHAAAPSPWLAAAATHTVAVPAGDITTIDTPRATAVGALPRFAVAAQTGPLTVRAGGRQYTVTVHRGDTLWNIAQQWLGDPHRWPEIYHLNADRYDEHGHMRGGNHIEPNWVLALPDGATPPAGADPNDPLAPPAAPPHGDQPGASPTADPPAPAPSVTPSVAPSVPAASASASPDLEGLPYPTPTGQADPGPATPSDTVPAPSITATPGPARDGAAARPSHPGGVSLPTGGWVDLGLALAIAAAVALVWKHRQRRHTRRPPSQTLRQDAPEVAPMPPVVNQIRRGLRRPAANGHSQHGVETDLVEAFTGTSHSSRIEDDHEPDEDVAPGEDLDNAGHADDEDNTPAGVGATAQPVVPALANPLSTLWPPAGLGLTGPGAGAAGRGFLAAALAAGGLDDPDARTWVVTPSTTAATLLGAAAVTLPNTPRLTVTAGLDEALRILEAQTLQRTRLVYDHEVDDVAALREADPFEEPLPPILLLADTATRHERARVAALLSQGQRLDIHGVLLGVWPDGDTVAVAADGATTAADADAGRHGSHPADIGRLAVLDPQETADLIAMLAESHTGQRQAPAPVENAPTGTAAVTRTQAAVAAHPSPANGDHDPAAVAKDTDPPGTTPSRPDAAAAAASPPPAAPHDGDEATPADTDPVPIPEAGTGHDYDPEPDEPGTGDPATTASAGRVEVSVLGTPGIVDGDPQRTMRGKSLELLVYLAVRDGDAHADAILDDLMPDAPATKAPHRLHTYVSDLRTVMRHNGGPGTYITHPRQRYLLNKDTIDVDLWRMRAALREADQTTDPAARVAALRRAVDAHGGPLAQGYDYEWIEPYRETVRQQALDAHLALADTLADQPAEQLAVLDAAMEHNPYTEELYQAAMRARAALGHLDAIRTLRRTLTRRLAEIDVEPTDETTALADQLVAALQRPGARPTPSPGDGATR